MSKKTITVDAIPFESKVNIVMPGHFYGRLQQFLLHYSSSVAPDKLMKAMLALKDKKEPEDDFEYHIHTLTILVHDIEAKAKEQGVMVQKEVEIEEGDLPPAQTT
jgi:hypothetical protein